MPLLLSYCRTSICCRQSVTRIHRFLEVTSPPAPLPPLGGCSRGHASFKLTDFSGRYKATNQSHYRWLIKQPWWMVRLQTIHLLLHQIGDNTFSSETAREIKTPVNCEELSLRLIRCSSFKDALNSELNIIRNNASIARCLAKNFQRWSLTLVLWHRYVIRTGCAMSLSSTRCAHFLVCFPSSQWFPAFPRMPFNSPQRVGGNLLISLKGRRTQARKQLETMLSVRL